MKMFSRSLLSVTCFLFVTIEAYAGVELLRPHRAVYDLSLKEASDRSGIRGIQGRIVYEMTGSKCEGFSVRFRFFTEVSTARKSFTNDQRTTSYESGDGRMFTFVNQSYLNGQLEQELKGKADRGNGATNIVLSKPEANEFELGDAIFMTEHVGQIIDAAQREQTILTAKVFDASDKGDELVDTTAIIGKKRDEVAKIDGETDAVSKQFEGQIGWAVSVSYFSTSGADGQGERLPVYQVSFILHENGVSRGLKMQYDDYALKGDLKNIEFLSQEPCE